MKKTSLFTALLFLGTTSVFAGDVEKALKSIGPEAILAAGLGGFIVLVGILLLYIAISYGIYLLAKKYEPKVHPAWSWIPVVQIYPLVRVSGQSLWWIAGILLGQFVPGIGGIIVLISLIYVYYYVAKRTGGDIGTTLLLIFFSGIMIPYLGLKAHKKSTTPAWILGVASILTLFVGGAMGLAGLAKGFMELEKDYNLTDIAQEKMMEEIKKNPELQKQFDDAMMKLEQNAEINVDVE
jgi:Family of unknown function (DUF5684)